MNVLALPLGSKLWHWDWDGTDQTISDIHPPVLRSDVAKWVGARAIRYSMAVGEDAPDGDNVAYITFESEVDRDTFRAKWCEPS